MEYNDLAIIVLAAGNSSRMGTSKQLLKVDGQTLLERVVRCSLESKISNITVVLGSNSEQHTKLIKEKPVRVLVNPDWALGIGNTLKFSLKKLLESNNNILGVLFLVCDQPQISTQHINNIINLFVNQRPVAIASQYKNTFGVPAIFDCINFPSLLSIDNSSGAKEVLKKLRKDLVLVPFDGGELDLDTPEDYQKFISHKN